MTILACVFGAVALYVLSTGPATRIVAKSINAGGGIPQWCEQVYAPVIWLRNETALRDPLDWYSELWIPSEAWDTPAQ